jgi:putative endonuclease
MPDTSDRQTLGKHGETLARHELERRGYAILATRFRTRFGEIDIVCSREGTIVFVEVKARRSLKYGGAAEAITPWKRRRIAAMALDYLASNDKLNEPCRFDVVAIDGIGTERTAIRVIEDAFQVDS